MAPEDSVDPGECRACRGGGKVISTLGGERREVDCPWCDGTGRFVPEHDAQARWREEGGSGAREEGGEGAVDG